MSKHLLLMRHAKSSMADSGMRDFDRPLNKRGMQVTPVVAKFVHLQGLAPQRIISSSACRAKMTSQLVVENSPGLSAEHLTLTGDFYLAPSQVYLTWLQQFCDDDVNILMFVGHNPGLEELASQLRGVEEVMPTAAVAHFELDLELWGDSKHPFEAEMKNLWRPRDIGIK